MAENHDPEAAATWAEEAVMDRLGMPDDVGNVAVFFASDQSSYVTAETILVDGGWVTIRGPGVDEGPQCGPDTYDEPPDTRLMEDPACRAACRVESSFERGS
nr:SDR family oxidoreductase [Halomarina sp. BND7]